MKIYHLVEADEDHHHIICSSVDQDSIQKLKLQHEDELKAYKEAAKNNRQKLHEELTEVYGYEIYNYPHGSGAGGNGTYYKYNCTVQELAKFSMDFKNKNPLPNVNYTGYLQIEESSML
jgi:hypothetical protein